MSAIFDEVRQEGKLEAFADLVQDGVLSLASAAERAGLSPDEFLKQAAEIGFPCGPDHVPQGK